MEEEHKIDPSTLVQTNRLTQNKKDESMFQSRFYSGFQTDKLIGAEEFQIMKRRFKDLNTRVKSDGNKMSLWCRLRDFINYGPAFPQFFAFLKHYIIAYTMMTVIFAGPALYFNYKAAEHCSLKVCWRTCPSLKTSAILPLPDERRLN